MHKPTACMDPLIDLLDLTSESTPSTSSNKFDVTISVN